MNPLNVAFGACGVAYVMKQVEGEVPRVIDWILTRGITSEAYPPGPVRGNGRNRLDAARARCAGARGGTARRLVRASLLWRSSDLFGHGAGRHGVVMNRRFFLATVTRVTWSARRRQASSHPDPEPA